MEPDQTNRAFVQTITSDAATPQFSSPLKQAVTVEMIVVTHSTKSVSRPLGVSATQPKRQSRVSRDRRRHLLDFDGPPGDGVSPVFVPGQCAVGALPPYADPASLRGRAPCYR